MKNSQKKFSLTITKFHWFYLTNTVVTEKQKVKLLGWLSKYEYKTIINAMNISYSKFVEQQYLSLDETFDKIGGICYNQNLNSLEQKKRHLINLIKKIHGDRYSEAITEMADQIMDLVKHFKLELDLIDGSVFPIVKKSMDIYECIENLDEFKNDLNYILSK